MLGLSISQLLGLTVVAAIVGVLGTLLGHILKDFVLSRSFEKWKERRSLAAIQRKYHDPLLLSGIEFLRRLKHFLENYPPAYMTSEMLNAASAPKKMINNTDLDPYYQRYRIISTIYRFCAFLGWVELYRQEVTFLNTGYSRANRQLEESLESIRSALADGQVNNEPDWEEWNDRLIFREELRAIGEAMIVRDGTSKTVVGYGAFYDAFERKLVSNDPFNWARVVSEFFVDFQSKFDFRRRRIRELAYQFARLIDVLGRNKVTSDRKRMTHDMQEWYDQVARQRDPKDPWKQLPEDA